MTKDTIKQFFLQKNLGTINLWNIFIINAIFKHIKDVLFWKEI